MRIFFNFGKIFILLLVLWLLVVFFLLGGPLIRSGEGEEALTKKLLDVQKENLALRKEKDKLVRQLRDLQNKEGVNIQGNDFVDTLDSALCTPSLEYEQFRRRANRDVHEMLNFVRGQLAKLNKNSAQFEETVNFIKDETTNHAHAVFTDLRLMKEHDGYDEWRTQEAEALSTLVQNRLNKLQNPEDCSTARKLLCNLNKGCGYGCQIHHAVYCFITAYGTKRTMILNSKGWRYNHKGYQEVFLPVSDTCTTTEGSSKVNWPGFDSTQVVELPIVDSVNPRPPFLPPAIPEDLEERITRLHGDPIVWWLGQFLKYMLRPQSHLKEMLDKTVESLGFETPIVGIHVRRTDKVGTEAAFHSVEEYMQHVHEWFNLYELTNKVDKRRVFVASDDPKVLGECRKKFSEYEFVGDQEVARSAAVSSRYTDSSLRGIIQDIHLLSESDYLVCTFSSQVCRIAYEIMQTRFPDAADRFKSLDDIFYFGGQSEHQQEVIYPHTRRNNQELDLQIGDVIDVKGNHWDGFNKGRNHRTNRMGLYPEYKTKEKIKVVKFPEYKEVHS